MNLPMPRPLGKLRGRPVFRFQVGVTQSGIYWNQQTLVPVTAHTATDAVRLVQDEIAPVLTHPAEIECRGPVGGIAHRFTGYEGMIWAQMCRVDHKQLMLI
jgi:hypothetical protein